MYEDFHKIEVKHWLGMSNDVDDSGGLTLGVAVGLTTRILGSFST